MVARIATGAPPPLTLDAEPLANATGVRIVIHGAPGETVALESSLNLTEWRTIQTFPNPTGTLAFDDLDGQAFTARFFRARRTDPPPVTVSPPIVPGGTVEFDVFGMPQPGDEFLLRWGDDVVTVLERTNETLRVRVPTNVTSGRLTWIDAHGTTLVPGRRIVAAASTYQLRLPPGLTAQRYQWINTYGTASVAEPHVIVRRGYPLLNFAVPMDPQSTAFFVAFSLDDRDSTTVDAEATAAALVFLSPLFYSDDVVQARRFLATAKTHAKVQALASAWTQAAVSGVDPLTAPEVERTLREALNALLRGAAVRNTPGRSASRRRHGAPAPELALDQFDLEHVIIREDNGVLAVRAAPGNPLEWVVQAKRIDVDRAFPQGRSDYRTALLGQVLPGQSEYPTQSGFQRRFLVESTPLLDSIDLAGLIGTHAQRFFFGASANPNGRFELPAEPPALYVLRAVSPAWSPAAEYDFVQRDYHEAYLASVRINLLAAAADIISAASPLPGAGAAFDAAASKIEQALSGLDALPPMKSPGDFMERVVDLATSLGGELGFSDLGAASTAGADAAGRASDLFGRILRAVGKATKDAFEPLDKAVDIGKALERALGLLTASPLESAFVEVGDPFRLQILEIKPDAGVVGDTIHVILDGRRYGTAPDTDGVAFVDGSVPVPSTDIEAKDLPQNRQQLSVRIPLAVAPLLEPLLGTTGSVERTLIVTAGGRRGIAPFRHIARPIIVSMVPEQGFAAVPNYLGAPFPGTGVRLRGYGFGPEDQYFFGSTEALDKSGTTGDVTLFVPRGASSGPIRVVPRPASPDGDGGLSPAFEVLGAPTLASHTPSSGPVGTTVEATVGNLGSGPVMMTLGGLPLIQAPLSGGRIAGLIPLGASSGILQVTTPAGSAGFEFTVDPGLATGALVNAGSNSLITLPRALALLEHRGDALWVKGCTVSPTCIDDEDVERDENGNPLRGLDPPAPDQAFEEGDFLTDRGVDAVPRFPVGRIFADTLALAGTVSGPLTLGTETDGDTILAADGVPATIEGDVILQGRGHRLVNLIIRGHLQVDGNDNVLEGILVTSSKAHGVTIRGTGNRIQVQCVSNTYDGLVIDGGRFNEVEVLSTANGGNGVTITGGAVGNRVSLSTGFLPTPGGLVPWRGNNAHGLALLGAAAANVVLGTSPIARNNADGAYLSGSGVVSNLLAVFHALSNGGHGLNLRDGANANSLDAILAEANGGSGVVIRGCPATQLRILRAYGNGNCGVQLIGIDRPGGEFTFDSRGNRAAGLRLESGTVGVEASGTSTDDSIGVELLDAGTTRNQIKALVEASRTDGAVVDRAIRNSLELRIRNGAGVGLRVTGGARENEFPSLHINNCQGHGLQVSGTGTSRNTFPNPRIGVPIGDEPAGNAGDGIRVEDGAGANRFGDEAGQGPEVRDNGGAGMRFIGPADSPNRVLHAEIHEDTAIGRTQTLGLVLEDGVKDMPIDDATITGHPDAGIEVRDSPRIALGAFDKTQLGNRLVRNGTGLRLTGAGTLDCSVAANTLVQNGTGLSVDDHSERHRIGGNNIIGDNSVGIRIDAASNHRIQQNRIRDNAAQGILLTGGTTNVLILDNLITRNAVGVEVSGPRTVANRVLLNSITANRGKGIRLDAGGNHEILAPVVESVGSQRITGAAFAEDGSRIELFSDKADEGEKFLGTTAVVRGHWSIDLELRPADVGKRFHLHATVTDTEHNTSEFGDVEGSGLLAPLLFVSTRDGNAELYRLDDPSAEVQRLTTDSADDRSPAPAPSGETAAFVSDRDGNREIYLLSLNGTNEVERLTIHPAADYDPAWRPDGSSLVFVSERDGNPDLYRMNADGTQVVRLTSDPSADRWPSYSPDGSRVCFASNRGGRWEVWLMNADGSDPQPWTSSTANNTHPRWSPGGSWIAFVSDRDGNSEIYTARPDGSEIRRWTDHPAIDTEPAWLDDGTLVFASDRDGGFELFQISLAGESPFRLTVSSGDNREPGTSR